LTAIYKKPVFSTIFNEVLCGKIKRDQFKSRLAHQRKTLKTLSFQGFFVFKFPFDPYSDPLELDIKWSECACFVGKLQLALTFTPDFL